MPGVHAVLTHADVPGAKTTGSSSRTSRCSRSTACATSASRSRSSRRSTPSRRGARPSGSMVEYEPLELVVDPERATEQEPLHPGPADDGPRLPRRPAPERRPARWSSATAIPDTAGDVTVEGVYEVGIQDQAFLGPESGLAVPDGEGGVDIYVATQWLHVDRDQVAPCLGLEPEQVRLHLGGVGGAFGGREDLSMQIHGAHARAAHEPAGQARLRPRGVVRRPRAPPPGEDLGRAPRDDARAASSACGCGSCSTAARTRPRSTAVTSNAASFACGPYRVDERADRVAPASTRTTRRAARCAGSAPSRPASPHEAQMDKLAAALGIDPVELRLLNALAPGDTLPTGQTIAGSLPAAEVIRRAAALEPPEAGGAPARPDPAPRRRRATRPTARASARHRLRGRLQEHLLLGGLRRLLRGARRPAAATAPRSTAPAAEVGQGVSSVMLQVARTELGIDDVTLAPPARPAVGSAGSASASRLTWMAARRRPARLPRRARGARAHGRAEVDVERVYHHPRTWPLDPETGQTTGERSHVALAVAAMRVVAEVDVELGLTRVVWIGTAQDVGKAINPQAVARPDRGRHRAGPRPRADGGDPDARRPDHERELHRLPDPDRARHAAARGRADRGSRSRTRPTALKGVGEPPTVVSTAAIVSALRDATGRALTRVPVRPDDIVGLGPPT